MFLRRKLALITLIFIIIFTVSYSIGWKIVDTEHANNTKKYKGEIANIITTFDSDEGSTFYMEYEDLDIKKIISIRAGIYQKISSEKSEINIILYNADNKYILKSVDSWYVVPDGNGGVNALPIAKQSEINKYSIKKGTYNIGFLDNITKNIYQSTTGRIVVRKDNAYVIPYMIDAKEIEEALKQPIYTSDVINVEIPKVLESEDNLTKMNGLIALSGHNSTKYSLFVNIFNKNINYYYRVPLYRNDWVEKEMGKNLVMSYFKPKIEHLSNEQDINVQYLFYEDNKIYTDNKIYYYKKDNDNLTLSFEHQGYNIQYNSECDKMIREKYIGIDKNNNSFIFRGALYKENEESNNYDIVVEVRNEEGNFSYTIPKKYSKYMADREGEKYAYSHILLNLSKEQLSDNGIIKLYLKNGDNYYTTGREYTYIYENNKYFIYDDIVREQYIGIDNNDNSFIFRGAVYIENKESSSYDIIVKIKNENGNFSYTIPKKYSKYMADRLGEKYAYSHILLNLSKEQLSNNGVIKLYLKKGDNYYTTGREYIYNFEKDTYSIK